MPQAAEQSDEWVAQFFQEEVAPRAEIFEASGASLEQVADSDSEGVDSVSGGGKGYHTKLLFKLAGVLGIPVLKVPQDTTRPPRDDKERNGQSDYMHINLGCADDRTRLLWDLEHGNFLQVYVSMSRPENDPEAPEVPTHLYATRPESFSNEPGTTSVVEMTAQWTTDLVSRGVLRRAHTIVPTPPFQWLHEVHERTGTWPDNWPGRVEQSIGATILVHSAVEAEQALPPEAKTRLLVTNDYGRNGDIPAYWQLLSLLRGNYSEQGQQDALGQSRELLGVLEDLQNNRFCGLEELLDAPQSERPSGIVMATR